MSVKKKRVCPRQRGSLENDNLCVCVCEYKKERESGKEKKVPQFSYEPQTI